MKKMDFGIKGLMTDNEHYLAVRKATETDDNYEFPSGRMKRGDERC